MQEKVDRISSLLHEAAETHHMVYRITDGEDPDWASWYADWLTKLSELPDLLEVRPVRSKLVYMLVRLDKEYTVESPEEKWEDYYARGLLKLTSGLFERRRLTSGIFARGRTSEPPHSSGRPSG